MRLSVLTCKVGFTVVSTHRWSARKKDVSCVKCLQRSPHDINEPRGENLQPMEWIRLNPTLGTKTAERGTLVVRKPTGTLPVAEPLNLVP